MIVALDFETHYSTEYSLSRMKEADYILDPRFEVIMCAVQEGDGPNEVFIGFDAVKQRLDRIDWSKAAMLNHNSRFDGAILAWKFGHVPALFLDTLSMARSMTHAIVGSSSLKSVARYLGLGEKGAEVVLAKGKRLADFTPNELQAYAGYCLNDNALCRAIFDRFNAVFPRSELAVIDMAIRMYVEPQVSLDLDKLREHREQVRREKEAVMERVAHVDKATFSSTAKFTALLEELGVDIPMKISPATGCPIPAMAKNDVAFKELCEDPDQPPLVQALLAARVSAKSTIDETRAETLIGLALREWPDGTRAKCPVPLKYYGSHTGRFSGDGGYNFQNLRRGSPLKHAIQAAPGWVVIHRDASQIEARMVAWLARCMRLVAAFANGRDVYSEFASGVYRVTVTKADKPERFVGKTCILGLGYQTGGKKLKNTLFIGNGGVSVTVTLEEAEGFVRYYRNTYEEIPMLWRRCEHALLEMIVEAGRHDSEIAARALQRQRMRFPGLEPLPAVTLDADAIWLPNGMPIAYPNLRIEESMDGSQYAYDGPKKQVRNIYGGKVTENISQGLSRVIITDIMRRVRQETGFKPFLSTHDSLDYCVPESIAEEFDAHLAKQFAVRPAWAPDLPLASEGGWGSTLGAAEEHSK